MATLPPTLGSEGHKGVNQALQQGVANNDQTEGAARSHNPRPSDWQCPKCPADIESRLYSYPGKFGLICQRDSSHEFHDMADLINMQPKKLPPLKSAAPVGVRTGETKIELIVETNVLQLLQQRFAERLAPSLAAVFRALTDASSFIVNSEVSASLNGHLGTQFKDGFQLAGAVFNLRKERDDLRTDVEHLKQQLQSKGIAMPVGQNGVTIYLTPERYSEIEAKAKFNNMSVDLYLSGVIKFAQENGWL